MAKPMLTSPVGEVKASPSFLTRKFIPEEEKKENNNPTQESSVFSAPAGDKMIIPQAESRTRYNDLVLPDMESQLAKITSYLQERELTEEASEIDYEELNNSPSSNSSLPYDVQAYLATKTKEEIEKNPILRGNEPGDIRILMWNEGFPLDPNSWTYQSLSKYKKKQDEKEAENRKRYEEDIKRNPDRKPPERIWTKQALRKKRIEELHIRYPNWREVCIRERCNLTEIRRRMTINEQYEPFTQDTSNWNYKVHPLYGFMLEAQRDREFIKSLSYWMPSPTGRLSERTLKMARKAREIADSLSADYISFIGAQYKAIPLDKLYYNNILSSKWGKIRYEQWVEEDGELPEREGNLRGKTWWALEGRYQRSGEKKRRRKTLVEQLEEDREELGKWIEEVGYGK